MAELLPENTAILESPPTYTSNPQKALDFQERDIVFGRTEAPSDADSRIL